MKTKILLTTKLLFLLFLPNILFSQNPTAPVVGSVRNFVLYTSSGSITNTGTNSIYSGNVGTNGGGTLVGFGTLTTQPTNLFTNTAATIQCNSDLVTLYSDLNVRVATTETPGGYLTQTLSPGIYHSAAAASVGGILTLDGGGNPNARFILKTDGAFTMAANSKIILSNGTEAKNVFWLAAGAIGIAAGAEARGIFVSLAGAISMGAGCTLQGSMLTLAGSITTLDNMNLSKVITVVNTMILTSNQTVAAGLTPATLVLTGNMSPVIKWQRATDATFSSPLDIANTTTSLSPGILTASTFFRAVLFIEDSFVYSNYVKITLPVPLPDLTGINSFVVFTSAGALTNTGDRTTFSGNIGNGAGPISGFPNPADPLLRGETDPITINCKANLPLLYNAIDAMTNTNNNHAVGFGNGEVLLPGVYSLAAAITVGGELIFDAQNDPYAVFVIKTAGAFATPTNTKMKLINGALASNIFWNIESGFFAGANTDLVGTFICHIGAIITGDNCSLEGRLLTMLGAVTVANARLAVCNSMKIASSQTIVSGTAPVNLVVTGNNSPIIKWQSSLTSSFKFPIEITTTETTLVIAPLTISTYYRAVILLDGALIHSQPIKITVTNSSIIPNLGPATSFTLFTSSGAVNNAGASTYEGNIGTNLGAITGFIAPNNTNLHIQDAITAVCADYLPEVFTTIKAIQASIFHSSVLGVGETLVPGVYECSAAVAMSGDLILDGDFQDNPVFIIKINGALTAASYSKMILINGASPSNVFWITDSAINIGAVSNIKGTFICLYGDINIGDASIFDGHFYTMNGVVSMSNCSLVLATTYPLPLLRLSANQIIAYNSIPQDLAVTGNSSPIIKWQSSLNSSFTNAVDIDRIAPTFTWACSNPLTVTTYFRAVITTAGVNEYTNYIKITILAPTAIPDMGSAGLFVLFTTAGAVTNHGSAIFSGYVGTNYGAINGYPNLSDPLLRTQDALTQSCAAALPDLFNLIKAIPTTAGHAAGFGGGEILHPGVIQVLEASTVGGDLILDGDGNENSVFVFKVTGAVWLAAGTRIVLINGAKAANVYWAIDGALGAGAACEVRGNYICLAGAIAFGENCLIEGRIYTIAGAIVLGNSQFIFTIPNLIVVTSNQSINSGSQPANLSVSSNSGTVLSWEKSVDNFATAGITINNTTNLLTSIEMDSLFETTYFRAVISGGLFSTVVTIKINPISIPGSISSSQFICAATLTENLILTGNNGTIAKWQKSIDLSFSNPIDINNTTAILTGNEIGTLNQTTYFRAVVQNCTSPKAYSNSIIIVVNTATLPVSISSNQTLCSPSQPADLEVSGAYSTLLKWQKSFTENFTSFITIESSNTILTGTQIGVVAVPTYFRAVVKNCAQALVNSAPILVKIAEPIAAGTVSPNQNFCSPSLPNSIIATNTVGTILRWESSESADFQMSHPISNATTTLNFTTPVALTTYYRAIIQGCNTATVASPVAVVSIAPVTTWNGFQWSNGIPAFATSAVLNANFTALSNIESCALTVNNGIHVLISSGVNVTLNGGLFVASGGVFTLSNSSNLLQAEGVTNSGIITVKRESAPLYKFDSTLWSSPVSGQNLRSFSIGTLINRFYLYNNNLSTNGNYENIYPNQSVENYSFELAKGYLVRAPDSFSSYVSAIPPATVSAIPGVKYLGQFTGTPNNGTIITPLNTSNFGFNLVGNPYPSAINLASFFTENQNNVDGTIWLWRKINDLGTGIGYATMTNLGIISSQPGVASFVDGIIQIGQGFFVKSKSGLSQTNLTLNNSMRSGDTSNVFFRNEHNENHRIWLNLSNSNGLIAQTLIGYTAAATNGFDYGIEGKSFSTNATDLTSLVQATEYAIQGRALPFSSTDIVPLNFKTNVAGSYTISIDRTDGLFSTNQAILLKDNITGISHNLKNSDYTFYSEIGNYNSRFEIVYEATLTTNTTFFDANKVIAYQQNAAIHISSGSFIMKKIELFDLSGRLIYSKDNCASTSEIIFNLSVSNQLLLIKITSEVGAVVCKKIMH